MIEFQNQAVSQQSTFRACSRRFFTPSTQTIEATLLAENHPPCRIISRLDCLKGRGAGRSAIATATAAMNASTTMIKRFALATIHRTVNNASSTVRASLPAASSHFPSITTRGYRGDSSDAIPTLTPVEEALIAKGKPRDDDIRARHVRPIKLSDLKLSAKNLEDLQSDHPDANETELELQIRRKRLIYRAKQRGWLEVDVLLGTWAHENVPSLNADELDQFEAFVNAETIDIYNVITLRLDVPESMKRPGGNGIVERIQEWARNSPLGRADPSMYRKVKTDSKLI